MAVAVHLLTKKELFEYALNMLMNLLMTNDEDAVRLLKECDEYHLNFYSRICTHRELFLKIYLHVDSESCGSLDYNLSSCFLLYFSAMRKWIVVVFWPTTFHCSWYCKL